MLATDWSMDNGCAENLQRLTTGASHRQLHTAAARVPGAGWPES
jgi:hypothetical protein